MEREGKGIDIKHPSCPILKVVRPMSANNFNRQPVNHVSTHRAVEEFFAGIPVQASCVARGAVECLQPPDEHFHSILLVAHAIEFMVRGHPHIESLRLVVNEAPMSKAAGVRPKLAKDQRKPH